MVAVHYLIVPVHGYTVVIKHVEPQTPLPHSTHSQLVRRREAEEVDDIGVGGNVGTKTGRVVPGYRPRHVDPSDVRQGSHFPDVLFQNVEIFEVSRKA